MGFIPGFTLQPGQPAESDNVKVAQEKSRINLPKMGLTTGSYTWQRGQPAESDKVKMTPEKSRINLTKMGLITGYNTWQRGQPAESDIGQRGSGTSLEELTTPTF